MPDSTLSSAILGAVARTRVEADLPAAVMAAIEAAGYVVIERGRWQRIHAAAYQALCEFGAESRVGLEDSDLDSAY